MHATVSIFPPPPGGGGGGADGNFWKRARTDDGFKYAAIAKSNGHQNHNPPKSLRSTGKFLLEVPRVRLKTYGDRTTPHVME